MRATRRMAAVWFLMTLGAGAARAQDGPGPHALWFSAGLGYGPAHAGCDGCGNISGQSGASGFLSAGGVLKHKLRLGGQLDVWTHHWTETNFGVSSGVTRAYGNVSATISYYPLRAPLFLRGGVGVGFGRFKSTIGGSSGATGFGMIVGAGYDVRVVPHVFLTPVTTLLTGWDGDQRSSGGGATLGQNLTHAVLSAGVGLTVY